MNSIRAVGNIEQMPPAITVLPLPVGALIIPLDMVQALLIASFWSCLNSIPLRYGADARVGNSLYI